MYLKEESNRRQINADHLNLLEKAVVKGLGLSFEKQSMLAIPSKKSADEIKKELSQLCKDAKPNFIIFLGEKLIAFLELLSEKEDVTPHRRFQFLGIPSIVADSLIDITDDINNKRKFWADLKDIGTR